MMAAGPLTFREAFMAQVKAYEELVRSGQHVPPPELHEALARIMPAASQQAQK